MRSLSLAKTQSWDFPEGKLTLTTYDAEQDCIYALSDSGDEDSSQSQIGIYRLKRVVPGEVSLAFQLVFRHAYRF